MVIFLAACTAESSSTLPLEEYTDPASRFSFAIPQGWQVTELPEESVLTFTPADYSGEITELRVYSSQQKRTLSIRRSISIKPMPCYSLS
jgi:hypothetical protein